MKSLKIASIGAILLLAGCVSLPPQYANAPSSISLDAGAEVVQIKEFLPTEEMNKYDQVKMVNCAIGGNARTAETNVGYCENKLKNEAHKLGSTLVLVKPEYKRVGVDTAINQVNGTQMNCTNCVDMKGIVLKLKSSAKTSG